MDFNKLLKEYFSNNDLMQLATISDGQPWLCSVYFVTDADGYLYWTSSRSRRHSIEIMNNPIVAATIVQDPVKKQALQITGNAHKVSLEDSKRVDIIYAEKFGYKDRMTSIMENKSDSRAYWILKPQTISFWDEVNFPNEPKQEIILNFPI